MLSFMLSRGTKGLFLSIEPLLPHKQMLHQFVLFYAENQRKSKQIKDCNVTILSDDHKKSHNILISDPFHHILFFPSLVRQLDTINLFFLFNNSILQIL
jgi:hypothetical protein